MVVLPLTAMCALPVRPLGVEPRRSALQADVLPLTLEPHSAPGGIRTHNPMLGTVFETAA